MKTTSVSTRILTVLTSMILVVSFTSCKKDVDIKQDYPEPVIEVELWTPTDEVINIDTDVEEFISISPRVDVDRSPIPLGEWFSVYDGIFMTSHVISNEITLEIQNQATYFNKNSILIIWNGDSPEYNFFIPSTLIPPYEFQNDYVIILGNELDTVDSFSIILEGDDDWDEALLLADTSDAVLDLNIKIPSDNSMTGQSRSRGSASDFDWTVMEPVIRWTPNKLGIEAGDTGILSEHELSYTENLIVDQVGDTTTLQQGGFMSSKPVYEPEVTVYDEFSQDDYSNEIIDISIPEEDKSTIYDLSKNPNISYAGLTFSNIHFEPSSMSLKGTVSNISNQGTSQNITIELLDDNFTTISSLIYGPAIPEIGTELKIDMKATPSASKARFVRMVG